MAFKLTLNGIPMEFKDANEAANYVQMHTPAQNLPSQNHKLFIRTSNRVTEQANQLLDALASQWYRDQSEFKLSFLPSDKKQSISIGCCDCGSQFTFTDREAAFYNSNNLSFPKRCKACREKQDLLFVSGIGSPYKNVINSNMHLHTECVGTGERVWRSDAKKSMRAPYEQIAYDPTNKALCSWIEIFLKSHILDFESEYKSSISNNKRELLFKLAVYYSALQNPQTADRYTRKYLDFESSRDR